MKSLFLPIILLLCLFGIWILNGSFKTGADEIRVHKVKLSTASDTTAKLKVTLYADTTLYSGYFGNFADFPPVLKQMLNPRRIDSILKRPLPIYYALTEKDRENYALTIDRKVIAMTVDTVIRGKKYLFTSLPVKFTNHSTDTLKYLAMDCSWLDSYFTNNKIVQFDKQLCYKNEPYIKIILPKQSAIMYFPIVLDSQQRNFSQKFRIGMSLQKFVNNMQSFWDFPFTYFLRPETSNMIWSNEVEILR